MGEWARLPLPSRPNARFSACAVAVAWTAEKASTADRVDVNLVDENPLALQARTGPSADQCAPSWTRHIREQYLPASVSFTSVGGGSSFPGDANEHFV